MEEIKTILVDSNGEVILRGHDGQDYLLESFDISVGGWTPVCATMVAPSDEEDRAPKEKETPESTPSTV